MAVAGLVFASAGYAGFRLFTDFSFYDDEGSLVLMSRWISDGHVAYRDFHSIYGPFYYFYQWVARTAGGGVVSHASVRLLAVLPWVLTSLLAFGYTLRATRSRVAALAAWLVTLRVLAFIASEPGHAQEICVLLITALVSVAATRVRPVHLGAAAALVAAIALTKINLGVYAGAGVLLVALAATGAGRARAMLFPAMAAVCVAAPVCLMAPLLGAPGEAWVRQCCALIVASVLPVVAILAVRPPDRVLGASHWLAMAAGFTGCAILALAWGVGQGTSLASIFRSIVLANLLEAQAWTFPMGIGVPGALAGVAGLGTAGLWLYGKRGLWLEWLRLAIGLASLGLALFNRTELTFAVALPFVWLVMAPSSASPLTQFQRGLLAAVTVLHALNVYPVAGSQLRFTMVLLTIVATICVHDALLVLNAGQAWRPQRLSQSKAALAVLTVTAYLFSLFSAVQSYRRLVPLDLPGTAGIHIDRDERANYRWVLQKIKQSCDSFISFPAMHSLYIWSGKLPPVYAEVDGWQPYLSGERQAVERRVLNQPRSCVLLIDHLVPFWLPPKGTGQRTLLGFIQENFIEVDARNDFHFLVRK